MNRKCHLFFLLLFVILPALVFSQKKDVKKRPWEGRNLYEIKSIRNLQVSPDNEYLLFVVSERNFHDNRNYSSIFILPTKGGEPKPLTDYKGSASNPSWARNADFAIPGERARESSPLKTGKSGNLRPMD